MNKGGSRDSQSDDLARHSLDIVFHVLPAFQSEFSVLDQVSSPVLVDSSDEDLGCMEITQFLHETVLNEHASVQ